MRTELWAAAAALLLAVAAASSALALAGRDRPWRWLSVAARGAGIAALAASLYLAATGRSGWSPLDLQQVALSLGLAMVLLHLVLSRVAGSAAGNPLADVLAGVLAVAAWLAIRPGGESLGCLERALPYRAEWALFLLGSAGALIAGASALALALPWPWARTGAWDLVAAGCFVATLATGTGILAGLWWSWQSTGSLETGDLGQSWMAVVWLLAAMSTAAWQLEKRAYQWAAGLALAAAGAALLGLLALPGIQSLMGT